MGKRKKNQTLIYGKSKSLKFYCHEVDALKTNWCNNIVLYALRVHVVTNCSYSLTIFFNM